MCAVALQFPVSRTIKTWFEKFGVEELKRPAQSSDLNFWDGTGLRPRYAHPTSVPNLINALMTECTQIPIAMLQNLVKVFPEEWMILQQQRETKCGMGCSPSTYV